MATRLTTQPKGYTMTAMTTRETTTRTDVTRDDFADEQTYNALDLMTEDLEAERYEQTGIDNGDQRYI
jgi:hypothetical protein